MNRVVVQYTVKPDRAAENEELVRAVYAELHETRPEGLRYVTLKLDDGVSLVHLAEHDEDGPNQLTPPRSSTSRRASPNAATNPRSSARPARRCLSAVRRVTRRLNASADRISRRDHRDVRLDALPASSNRSRWPTDGPRSPTTRSPRRLGPSPPRIDHMRKLIKSTLARHLRRCADEIERAVSARVWSQRASRPDLSWDSE
jgi:hypothetical protein